MKLLSHKWFPQLWLSDPCLSRCSPATRGLWMDALCSMMQSNRPSVSGNIEELARLLRCSSAEITEATNELQTTKTAEVSMQNGCITWTCRRLKKAAELSEKRTNAAQLRWDGLCKQDAKPTLEAVKLQAAKSGLPDTEAMKFWNYYESNGWRVGKNPMRSWTHAMANWKRHWEEHRALSRPMDPKQAIAEANKQREINRRYAI